MTEPTHQHACIARCYLFETKTNATRIIGERHGITPKRLLKLSCDFSPGFLVDLADAFIGSKTTEAQDVQIHMSLCVTDFDRAVMLMLLAELSL